jgi:hypothetical protein
MAHFKKWDYYYLIPQNSLTGELIEICGPPSRFTYSLNLHQYAANRYTRMLAGCCFFKVSHSMTGESLELGDLILLPHIGELEEREAVNLVLEDLLQLPQIVLPPEWVEGVAMPLVPDIEATIAKKRAAISALQTQIAEEEQRKRGLEEYKQLLYATSFDLENIFAACLEQCGGKITPAKYSKE